LGDLKRQKMRPTPKGLNSALSDTNDFILKIFSPKNLAVILLVFAKI
jgi:hypothetical protein